MAVVPLPRSRNLVQNNGKVAVVVGDVVELVDTTVLKAVAQKACRFDSGHPYLTQNLKGFMKLPSIRMKPGTICYCMMTDRCRIGFYKHSIGNVAILSSPEQDERAISTTFCCHESCVFPEE